MGFPHPPPTCRSDTTPVAVAVVGVVIPRATFLFSDPIRPDEGPKGTSLLSDVAASRPDEGGASRFPRCLPTPRRRLARTNAAYAGRTLNPSSSHPGAFVKCNHSPRSLRRPLGRP